MTGKIAQVILWVNGMVTVFAEDGSQIPEYGGQYGEVKDRILQEFHREWQLGEWDKGLLATFHPNVYLRLKEGTS